MSHQADMSFPRKQVVLQKPDGKQICLNAFVHKTQTATQIYTFLSISGDAPLLESTSAIYLLSTKKVVRLIQKDLMADAFLLLVQQDDSLQDILENAKSEPSTGEALLAELVPGNTAPIKKMRGICYLFLTLLI
jgi:hypothetical protein